MYCCNYNVFATHHSRIGGSHGNSEQCLIGKNEGYLNSGTFGSGRLMLAALPPLALAAPADVIPFAPA
jgi:hypothetical protein